MILSKEFNRSQFARDSDLTVSSRGVQPPTVLQWGANKPEEIARSSLLAAPYVNGFDLNCGCPQSWACAETLGAALMEKRELVRDMVIETRQALERDGWGVGKEKDIENPQGRSVSVKIRVHKDLRKTMDFIETVIGDQHNRHVDWLTIHPRTRSTPSSTPIFGDSLAILIEKYGARLPVLLSGDVFSLSSLPLSPLLAPQKTITTNGDTPIFGDSLAILIEKYGTRLPVLLSGDVFSLSSLPLSPLLAPQPTITTNGESEPALPRFRPSTTKLAGLMSARGILANPALYAGHESCPWEAVEAFLRHLARAPLHLKLVLHHLGEMCGPGMGPDKNALLNKGERVQLNAMTNMCDVIDFMDEVVERKTGRKGGVDRLGDIADGVDRMKLSSA
ncbi:hypothetical protein BN1723_015366, partial [Verticillium longisporum]